MLPADLVRCAVAAPALTVLAGLGVLLRWAGLIRDPLPAPPPDAVTLSCPDGGRIVRYTLPRAGAR